MGVLGEIKKYSENMVRGKFDYNDKLKRKIEKRFLNKYKGILKLKLRDRVIGIKYMYGGKYAVLRKFKNGKPHILAFIADINKVVDIIVREKDSSKRV